MKTLACATLRCGAVRLLSVLLFILLLQSCAKNALVTPPAAGLSVIPTPATVLPVRTILVQPFKSFVTTYNVPLTNTNDAITLGSGVFSVPTNPEQYQNAEVGFAFRSNRQGSAIGLGLMLPANGYAHTVTLWDSATQEVLARVSVTESNGAFTYTNLTRAIVILANHGYVVGYNTLAIGNPLDTYSAGNEFYLVNGIYVDGGLGRDLPLVPFTQEFITVEKTFVYNYGINEPPANLFPPAADWSSSPNGFFGLSDITFSTPEL